MGLRIRGVRLKSYGDSVEPGGKVAGHARLLRLARSGGHKRFWPTCPQRVEEYHRDEPAGLSPHPLDADEADQRA